MAGLALFPLSLWHWFICARVAVLLGRFECCGPALRFHFAYGSMIWVLWAASIWARREAFRLCGRAVGELTRSGDRFARFVATVFEGLAWYQARRRWRIKGQGVIAPRASPFPNEGEGCRVVLFASWTSVG